MRFKKPTNGAELNVIRRHIHYFHPFEAMMKGHLSCQCLQKLQHLPTNYRKFEKFCLQTGWIAFLLPLHPTLSQTFDFSRSPGHDRTPSAWLPGQSAPNSGVGTSIHVFRHSGTIPSAFVDLTIVQFQFDSQYFDLCSPFGRRVTDVPVVLGNAKTSIFPSVSYGQSLREAA